MAKTKFKWHPLDDNVLIEKDENGQTTATYSHEPGLYGGLISQRRQSQSSFYHFDGQGSTRAITDASENVSDQYTFAAFGEPVVETGATENTWLFRVLSG